MPFCGPGSLPCCVIPFRRQRLPWHCGLLMAFLIFRLSLKYLLKESLIWPSHYHGTFLISSTEVKAFQHHLIWQSAPQTLPLSLSLRVLHVRDMVCFVYCPISAMGHVLERVPENYGKRKMTQIMGTEVIVFPFFFCSEYVLFAKVCGRLDLINSLFWSHLVWCFQFTEVVAYLSFSRPSL